MKKRLISTLIALLACIAIQAQPAQLSFTTIATGFTDPIDLTHAGDDRIFVVERKGYIYIMDQAGTVNSAPFLDLDARINSGASERGLLGLAFHPEYATNGYFFVYYTDLNGGSVISRFSVNTGNPDLGDPSSEVQLLTFSQPFSNHNGGSLKFGPDNYLYVGSGDGGSAGDPNNNGQKKKSYLGKILRLDVDQPTTITPPSNPFITDTAYYPEIWALGLRNPWRIDFDRATGDLWIGDVGQNSREEIDYQAASSPGGENYGWRCYEANLPYNTSNCSPQSAYTDPVFHYTNNSSTGCSVTGGTVYRGIRHKNLWGTYFLADYCTGNLWYSSGTMGTGFSFTLWPNQLWFNPSAFGRDVYGEVYIVSYGGDILRIGDSTCTPKAYIASQDSVTFCSTGEQLEAYSSPGFTYQWLLNGTPISGATSPTLTPMTSGNYTVEVTNGTCSDVSDPVLVNMNALSVTLSGLNSSYFTFDPPVTMTGTPAGGIFSGPCVTGNQFDPGCGPFGIIEIVYTYTDSSGCIGADTVILNITSVGIEEAGLLDGFAFYPNPGQLDYRVRFNLNQSEQVGLEVVDALGRLVYESSLSLSSGPQEEAIRLSNVSPGMYFLNLSIGERKYSQRFVVTQ